MMGQFVGAGAVCGVLCLICYFAGYRRAARRYDIIVEVPTLQARDIPGLGAAMVEVKGYVELDEPLISDLARVPCFAFECSVTEHWTTTRVVRDSKGRTRTETVHHSETHYSNDARTPFQLRDESGTVTVSPDGASIDMLDGLGLRGVREPMPDSPAYGICPRHGGTLSYSEQVFPVGQWAYILGQVSENHDIIEPRDVDRPFIISHRSEQSLLTRALWGKRIFGGLTMALFIAAFALLGIGLGVIDGHDRSWHTTPARPSFPRPAFPHR